MSRLLVFLIRLYQQTLGTVLPPVCRFEPSCSHYAAAAINQYGAWRGMLLTLRRLLRCHPFSPSGYDPVPPANNSQSEPKCFDSSALRYRPARKPEGLSHEI